jgi:hypothetical protein
MISFKESFLLSEKVSNSEINSAFNDPNIIVGIEYEFYLIDYEKSDGDKTNKRLHLMKMIEEYQHWDDLPFDDYQIGKYHSADADSPFWRIEYDTSLLPEEGGVEIVSPKMPVREALKYMKGMFDFIKKHGKTTSKTGLHVNMSYEGKSLSEIDELKLMLFMDEDWVWKKFPERIENKYAASNYDHIIDSIKLGMIDKNPELEQISDKLIGKYKNTLKGPKEKYFGINTKNEN